MSQWLPYLLVLVCPLTMGVMMWLMMRGRDEEGRSDPRLAQLERQVRELRSGTSEQPAAGAMSASPPGAGADRA
jgi:hypothetical protein